MQSVEQVRLDDVPSNAASVALSFRGGGDLSLGIEGGYPFIRAVGWDGVVVLDRVVDFEGDVQSFPPGDYTLIPYYRTCSGNCGRLDPEQQQCSIRRSLEADRKYSLSVVVGGGCTFTEVSPS